MKLRSKIFLFLSNYVIFEQSIALFWISFDFELLLVDFVFAIFISNFTTAFVISCLGEGGSRSFLSQGRNVDRINFLMALLGSSFSNGLDYDEDRQRRWLLGYDDKWLVHYSENNQLCTNFWVWGTKQVVGNSPSSWPIAKSAKIRWKNKHRNTQRGAVAELFCYLMKNKQGANNWNILSIGQIKR